MSTDEPLVPRLRPFRSSIFAEMSATALATGSVNLGQGFPDVDGPESVAEAAVDAIREHRGNQYPPSVGVPVLREAVATHQREQYGIELDPAREVVATAGATEGLASALMAFLDEGDEVVTFEPFFDSYLAVVAQARGRLVPVRLSAPDFRVDEERLRAAITDRTRVLLVNSPHNPTGAVLDEQERDILARVAVEHDLIVVTDEVYEHMAFDRAHVPLATLPGMWERTLTISSAGKTFSFTGWKIGWFSGPSRLVSAALTVKQFLSFASGGPFQHALAYALTHEMAWVKELGNDLERRRDLLCDGLQDLGLTVHRPAGTYFVTTDVRPLGWDDGLAFCRELPTLAKVAAIPCSALYLTGPDGAAGLDDDARALVRWTFTKRDDVLHEALDRLAAADLTR